MVQGKVPEEPAKKEQLPGCAAPRMLPSLLSTLLKVRDSRAEEQARDVEKPTGW